MLSKEQADFGFYCYKDIDNPIAHTTFISQWDFIYQQVSAGQFNSQLNYYWLDDIGIYQEYMTPSVFQHGQAKTDTLCLGVFRNIQQPALWMGQQVSQYDLVHIRPQQDIMIKTPEKAWFYALHLPLKLFFDKDEEIVWPYLNAMQQGFFNRQLYQKMLAIINYMQAQQHHGLSDLVRQYLKADLLTLADEYLNVGQYVSPLSSAAQYKAQDTVKFLINYLKQHQEQAISLDQCCALTQLSRRSLQNYFEKVTGHSPLLFLKYWRLNGVRRMLQCEPKNISIGDIASRWGFWHLSQFALDYKRLFTETPSMTRYKALGIS